MSTERMTKYVLAVQEYMHQAGHATNAQILAHLQQAYPELSATTVHRITARMVERGQLDVAPSGSDQSTRFDANTSPHDHFQCRGCDRLRDVDLPASVFEAMQQQIGDCKVSGRLVVQGTCARCMEKEKCNE